MERRQFLTGVLGCSLAASPLVTPIALAQAPWDTRLVVILLRGALDGLDAVRPLGDPDYAGLRPTIDAGDGLPVGDFWALHPSLAPLLPLYRAGEVGVVHAVSTPYRDKRSHFDGQDILEAGTPGLTAGTNDGWLNRLLQVTPGLTGETAFVIGREQMQILTGSAPAARWSPEAQLDISPQAQRLLELVYHDDPLFRDASAQAVAIAAQLQIDAADDAPDMGGAMMMDGGQVIKGEHVDLARFAAGRLRGETRIASFSINGWDTHLNQRNGISRALSNLSDTLLALKADLGPIWGQTAVLCLTEFGRTARENGTRGTDHGTGGAMIYAGGALRGGQVTGDWPGLAEADLYKRRDLMPQRDVRALAGWVMAALLGVNRDVIETTIFPGLEMGRDPGIVA